MDIAPGGPDGYHAEKYWFPIGDTEHLPLTLLEAFHQVWLYHHRWCQGDYLMPIHNYERFGWNHSLLESVHGWCQRAGRHSPRHPLVFHRLELGTFQISFQRRSHPFLELYWPLQLPKSVCKSTYQCLIQSETFYHGKSCIQSHKWIKYLSCSIATTSFYWLNIIFFEIYIAEKVYDICFGWVRRDPCQNNLAFPVARHGTGNSLTHSDTVVEGNLNPCISYGHMFWLWFQYCMFQ